MQNPTECYEISKTTTIQVSRNVNGFSAYKYVYRVSTYTTTKSKRECFCVYL